MPTQDENPHDPHDPRRESERQDNLVLLALGEPVSADFELHRNDCAECRYDLEAFRRTVQLGRETSAHREHLQAEPPASIWSAIAAQVGPAGRIGPQPIHTEPIHTGQLDAGPVDAGPVDAGRAQARSITAALRSHPIHRPRHRAGRRTGLLAAAVALVVAGVAGGFAAGQTVGTHRTHVASDARLARVAGGPAQVSGAASVRSSSDGRQVSVTTTGLPLRDGFYEVWLYDPDRGPGGDMVAIGALGDRGRGTFTLPSGIDIREYNIVNVSAQSYGGGVRIVHAQSVLQGTLTQ